MIQDGSVFDVIGHYQTVYLIGIYFIKKNEE